MKRGGWHTRFVMGLALLASAAAMLLPAGPVRAADASFGTPKAVSTFGESIEFTVPFTAGAAPERIELRLGFPGALGPYIIDIAVGAWAGSQTLRHVLITSGSGHIAPNTPIVATWAAYTTLGAEPVLSAPLTVRYADTTHEWRNVAGDLVTVHWYKGSEGFARRALRIGEDAVRETATLLGVSETEPIDFFIYADDASFRAALGPGSRENIGGTSHSDIRTLFALITPAQIDDTWVGIVVPHELVHLVFGTAVRNPYRLPPLWFNEGLAVYLSEGYGRADRSTVESAVATGDLLPLSALDQFPRYGDRVNLAYAESVSAIDHLIRTDGDSALLALVDAYGDGLTDDEAFTAALGRTFEAFQAGWLGELGAQQPERYGPQPAPAGPLPPGWSGPGNQPGPGVTPGAVQPSAPETAAPGGDGNSSERFDAGAVLAAILVVVAVVVVAIAMTRRRQGSGVPS